MKSLRSRFERFCFRHRNWGIPNLMLFVTLGSGLVYLYAVATHDLTPYFWLVFDRELILYGQVWRLISFPLTYFTNNLLLMLISLFCYYSLGREIENAWGTLRFNLFYLSGIVMMDLFSMAFNCQADVLYLNLSLFLAYATMYPNAHFLLFFIIPVKAWIFALVDLAFVLLDLFSIPFTIYNLFPLISLANYFLFFGKDVLNVFPVSWQINAQRLFRKKSPPTQPKSKPIPFPGSDSYDAGAPAEKADYTHRCTVCGRTDRSNPELEFRYCSRCNGYYCYCQDHISNHTHIQ